MTIRIVVKRADSALCDSRKVFKLGLPEFFIH